MQNFELNRKIMIVNFIFMMYGLKVTKVAKDIHVANSTVSMYLTGERKCTYLELYLIEKVFNIKIKDYTLNTEE